MALALVRALISSCLAAMPAGIMAATALAGTAVAALAGGVAAFGLLARIGAEGVSALGPVGAATKRVGAGAAGLPATEPLTLELHLVQSFHPDANLAEQSLFPVATEQRVIVAVHLGQFMLWRLLLICKDLS